MKDIIKEALLVFGMHRCGTSLTANILNNVGYDVGTKQMKEDRHFNPNSFYENTEIYKLNENILENNNISWHSLNLLHSSFKNFKISRIDEQNLENIILEEFNTNRILIKDPRLSILLPLYTKVLSKLNYKIKCIICFRAPQQVALSLNNRDLIDFNSGVLLYCIYLTYAELYSRDYNRVFIEYGDQNKKDVLFNLFKTLKLKLENDIEILYREKYRTFKQNKKTTPIRLYKVDSLYRNLKKSFSDISVSKRDSYLYQLKSFTPLNRDFKDIQDTKHNFFQIFTSENSIYSETNSYRKKISLGINKIEITNNQIKIEQCIRIDPVNDCCVIEIKNLYFELFNGSKYKPSYSTNCDFETNNLYFFNHKDPQIHIAKTKIKIKAVYIVLFIANIGTSIDQFVSQKVNESKYLISKQKNFKQILIRENINQTLKTKLNEQNDILINENSIQNEEALTKTIEYIEKLEKLYRINTNTLIKKYKYENKNTFLEINEPNIKSLDEINKSTLNIINGVNRLMGIIKGIDQDNKTQIKVLPNLISDQFTKVETLTNKLLIETKSLQKQNDTLSQRNKAVNKTVIENTNKIQNSQINLGNLVNNLNKNNKELLNYNNKELKNSINSLNNSISTIIDNQKKDKKLFVEHKQQIEKALSSHKQQITNKIIEQSKLESKYISLNNEYYNNIKSITNSKSVKLGFLLTYPLRFIYELIKGRATNFFPNTELYHCKAKFEFDIPNNSESKVQLVSLKSNNKKQSILLHPHIFNFEFYKRLKNIDSKEEAIEIWLSKGYKSGDQGNSVFYSKFYLDKYQDVKTYSGSNILMVYKHWLNHGIKEKRQGSYIFNINEYSKNVSKLKNPTEYINHWQNEGIKGAVRSSKTFNLSEYISINKDIKNYGPENIDKLVHFVKYGIKENRKHGNLDAINYKTKSGNLNYDENKKNILVVGHSLSKEIYGGERSFLDIIRNIDKRKYNVVVSLPGILEEYYNLLNPHCCNIIYFKYKWWKGKDKRVTKDYSTFKSIIRNYNIHIIHINTLTIHSAVNAGIDQHIPTIIHVREIFSKDEKLRNKLELTKKIIDESIILSSAHLLCNSNFTFTEYKRKSNFSIIPNTVADSYFEHKKKVNKNKILCVGLISSNLKKKGIFDFFEVAKEVNKSIKTNFYFIGQSTKELDEIKYEVKHKGLENIHFKGYVKDPINELLNLDIVLNLSHFAESFGRTIAESGALGIPSIIYNYGALSELVDDGITGFIVPFKDIKAVSEKIIYLNENRSILDGFGKSAKEKIKKQNSYSTFSKKLNNLYWDLLNQKNVNETTSFSKLSILDPLQSHKLDKIKLAYFLWHFPVPSETFVLNELRFLVESGVDVQVFCKESPYKFKPDFKIKYIKVKTPENLKQQLVKNNINIVHAHFTYPTVSKYVWPVCNDLKLPFTFIAHAQDIFKKENIKLNRIAEISRSKYCLRILTLGKFHKNFLIGKNVIPSKIVINPQVIYNNDFKTTTDLSMKNHKVIVAIGRFVEKKGFENLILASKYIEDPNIIIKIYGYGPLEDSYKNIIKNHEIQNVQLCGKLNGSKEVLNVFLKSDLIIQPSVIAKDGDMDGIPTILVEAMTAGLPIMSTDIASISEILKDKITGLKLNNSSPAEISSKIKQFYSESNYLTKYRITNAKQRIKEYYDIDSSMNTLLRIWKGVAIDIVLVTYINVQYPNLNELKEIITRIYKFTNTKFTLTIVDNNSSDSETQMYFKEIEQIYTNIKVIYETKNHYVGPATNIALEETSNDFIIYLCAVEGYIINYNWEREFINYFQSNPDVGLAGTLGYSPVYLKGNQLEKGIKLFKHFRNKSFALNNPDKNFYHVQGGLFGIRREMYNKIGGFNVNTPHAYTDVEYSYYVESMGWKLGSVQNILSLYEKTRPELHTRIDENILAIHPGKLSDTTFYDNLHNTSIKFCNICNQTSSEKYNCDCTSFERTVYRYLAESNTTFRNLDLLIDKPSAKLSKILNKCYSVTYFNSNINKSNVSNKLYDVIVLKNISNGDISASKAKLKINSIFVIPEDKFEQNNNTFKIKRDILYSSTIIEFYKVKLLELIKYKQ